MRFAVYHQVWEVQEIIIEADQYQYVTFLGLKAAVKQTSFVLSFFPLGVLDEI